MSSSSVIRLGMTYMLHHSIVNFCFIKSRGNSTFFVFFKTLSFAFKYISCISKLTFIYSNLEKITTNSACSKCWSFITNVAITTLSCTFQRAKNY